MSKKKENLLGKIVKKDYNNELEKVIETKDFDEDVKNLLLAIFYKIDISYKDYKKVKRKVESKQEYIEKIIKIIKNNCNSIKIVKPNSKKAEELGNRTFLIDKQTKSIICYPIERKLLYSISKISNQENIIKNKYILVNNTLSNLINIGSNINTVEPLRDFNGWSWLIIKKEIENIPYNLIYQNLRILVGEKFLNSWITNKEDLIDYYEELRNELEEKFGKKITSKILLLLEKISILLEIEINPEYEKNLKEIQEKNEQLLCEFEDNKEFIEKLTEEKKKLNKNIKIIEKIISSKESLEEEYTKINKNLPMDQKIFSIKILEKQLQEEKKELREKLDEKNELLNPKKFIEKKTKLKKVQELLQIVDVKNKIKKRNELLEEFQKVFLDCFLVFVNTAETKEEIIDLIYILRYYNLLPFNEKIDIYKNKKLQKDIENVQEELLNKAIEYKIITSLSQEKEENTKLLKAIFESKMISIEDIYIAVIKTKDKYYIEFSEDNENSYEQKIEIDDVKKEKLDIKLNKKIKVFN